MNFPSWHEFLMKGLQQIWRNHIISYQKIWAPLTLALIIKPITSFTLWSAYYDWLILTTSIKVRWSMPWLSYRNHIPSPAASTSNRQSFHWGSPSPVIMENFQYMLRWNALLSVCSGLISTERWLATDGELPLKWKEAAGRLKWKELAISKRTEHAGKEAPGLPCRQQQISRHSHGQHRGPTDQAGVQRSCQKRRGAVTLKIPFYCYDSVCFSRRLG